MAHEIFVHIVFKIKHQNHLQRMKRFEFKLKIPAGNFNEANILCVPWIKSVMAPTTYFYPCKKAGGGAEG